MNEIQVIQGIEGYEENGVVYLRLETVARGLGFTDDSKGTEYVRWNIVKQYLKDIGFSQEVAKNTYIPENIFYRLAMKAKNAAAEAFQSKVADEIIPTLRRTGTYSIKQSALPSGVLEGAKIILEAAGITGNQAALALDKVYRHHTGYSMLGVTGIELEAPTKRQLLTPTEIAKYFDGMNARKINDVLAGAGYQYKINDNWEPLEIGMQYAVMLDTNKKHSDGTPVRQLKWDSSILESLRLLIDRTYD